MSGVFSLQLQKFAEKAGARADEAVSRIVIASAAKIDARSPVGNPELWKHPAPAGYVGGHFRANWQLGINELPRNELPGVDASGGETQAKLVAEVPDKAAGNVYYIANNVPYALRLEYGWSSQAPQGMVGLVATEMGKIVSQAVAGAKEARP